MADEELHGSWLDCTSCVDEGYSVESAVICVLAVIQSFLVLKSEATTCCNQDWLKDRDYTEVWMERVCAKIPASVKWRMTTTRFRMVPNQEF